MADIITFDGMVQPSRMKKLLLLILTALLGLTASPAHAAFLDTEYGARPTGMGGAFTAIADDSNAPLYNPAGIVQVQWNEMSAMYSELFSGLTLYSGNAATGGDTVHLDQSYLAYISKPLSIGSFGLSWANFNTTSLYREDTVTLSYAHYLGDVIPVLDNQVSLGMNLKYLREGYTLDAITANDPVFASGNSRSAVTGDVGLLWKPEEGSLDGWRVGFTAQNVTQPNLGFQQQDPVPLEYRLGLAYQDRQRPWLVPALDFTRSDGVTGVDGGVESWLFNDMLGLRAGANFDEASAGISYYQTLGKKTGFRLDYSFTVPYYVQDSAGSHRLQITVYF
jgi:hypothetical protein